MDALCSMSSYCLALAPVLGGNYCSFNFSPFSFFYRTEPKVSSSLSFSPERYILSDHRPKSQVLCLHRPLHDHANIKKRWEYWCSVAFFLFTDASAAIMWPQRQQTSPQIPVAVASHLIKTRLAHMFLWQVSSSLCTGDELWICTPAERAVILGSVHVQMHIWWQTLQQNTWHLLACMSWNIFAWFYLR